MRVLLAGATGAIGGQLVPVLQEAGHTVIALTRPSRGGTLPAGVEVAVADALDAAEVTKAVRQSQPDAIVHQLTALSGMSSMRNFDKAFAATNRLRVEGTDNLLAAADAAGVTRVVAQSYTGWPYGRTGSRIKSETDPLDSNPLPTMARSLEAIVHLENAVTEFGGTVHRYGSLYGPGTNLGPGGEVTEMIKARKFPLVGSGDGVWSFIHVRDAAKAVVRTLENPVAGYFNICDDEPAPIKEWLPYFAKVVGAKSPLHIPAWLGRLAAGEAVVSMQTDVPGASNTKAKNELKWLPEFASWRRGFAQMMAA
ncbi:MAG: NAD(P)-dependent oxidoreductase [Corynebacteriales bacterium]|nr:NAD(P)-dependent oxidoreductase [Mycobacteriales bacterium]